MRAHMRPGFLAVAALALLAGPGHATVPGPGRGQHAGSQPSERITATHLERYGLQVSPARVILPAVPGAETRTFTVADLGRVPLLVKVSIAEYAQQPNGTIVLMPPGPLSAANWVRITPTSLVVPKGTMRKVRVRVTVPPHPEPGERYLAVIFRAPPQAGSHDRKNIAVSGAIGAEMLVNVPGPVVHKITFGGLSSPGFSAGGTIPLTVTVHNQGTVHQLFAGRTTLTARYGSQVIRFPSFLMLRSSTRIISVTWASHPWMCDCTLRLTASNGDGQNITVSTRMVIFPVWTVLGIVLAVAGLTVLTAALRRHARTRTTRHTRHRALA